jgi:LacI family transcriptional regulator
MTTSDTNVRIGLVFTQGMEYGRRILLGIRAYVQTGKPWIFQLGMPSADLNPVLAEWDPAGVIGYIFTPEHRDQVMALGRPIVNVSSQRLDIALPRVGIENRRVGELAATYFLDRGMHHFAFFGFVKSAYTAERREGYLATLRARGATCDEYQGAAAAATPPPTTSTSRAGPAPAGKALRRELESDGRWLRDLPRPCAVFAGDDQRAAYLTEAARVAGVRVPEDVAVLGVNDEELMTGLSNPPLSSIAIPLHRVGYEAAALLDRLLAGEPAPAAPVLLPPVGVVERRSTDVLGIRDEDVRSAVRFIREHVADGINVEDVLRQVPLSRRALEYRFREALDRTPLEEIQRARVARAKQLLAGTELGMRAVALRSGFANAERLAVVFHQEAGLTPTGYRRQFRLHELPGAAAATGAAAPAPAPRRRVGGRSSAPAVRGMARLAR